MAKAPTPRRTTKAPLADAVLPRKRTSLSLKTVAKTITSHASKIPMPKSYTPILVTLLIIAAFLTGMLYTKVQYLQQNAAGGTGAYQAGNTQPAAGNQQPPAGAKVNVEVGDLPVMGNKDAKVKVVEFADFQCPFCEQWFKTVESSLISDYVKTGKVAFYWRDYAFLGQESTWAAEAARCANDQGKFWDFHDYLYTHQGQENSGAFSKANLEGFAATLGLDTGTFNSCLDSDKYASAVASDMSAGQKAGVSGTPTVFIDGQPIVGAQPYTAFKSIIDQELSKK